MRCGDVPRPEPIEERSIGRGRRTRTFQPDDDDDCVAEHRVRMESSAASPPRSLAVTEAYRWLVKPQATTTPPAVDQETCRTRYALRGRRSASVETCTHQTVPASDDQEARSDWLAIDSNERHPLHKYMIQLGRAWRRMLKPWSQQLTAALQRPRSLVFVLNGDRATVDELLKMQQTYTWVFLDPIPGQRLRSVWERIRSVDVVALDLLAIQSTPSTTQLIRDLLYYVANLDLTQTADDVSVTLSVVKPMRFLLYGALEPTAVEVRVDQPQTADDSGNASGLSRHNIDELVQSILDDLLTVRERPYLTSESLCLPSTATMLRPWLTERGLFLPGPLLLDANMLMVLDRELATGSMSLVQLVQVLRFAYSWVQARLMEQPNQQTLLDACTRLYQEWLDKFQPAFLLCLQTCQILGVPITGLALQARLFRRPLSADTALCRRIGAAMARASAAKLGELCRAWGDSLLEQWLSHPESMPVMETREPFLTTSKSSASSNDLHGTFLQPADMARSRNLANALATSKRRRQQLQAALVEAHQRPGSLQTLRDRALERFLAHLGATKPPPRSLMTLLGFPGSALAEAPVPVVALTQSTWKEHMDERSDSEEASENTSLSI
ncbi:hypothetical protein F1559_000885 [Cyanidiococcus yangmingshanensis]|uniref:Uncharacterized protein n=1 Tax=Cyanidiococcus yangmingshanensis TaxID=2690220 RepID=A0A7J7IFV0_9RHOD|nr:hypothetical protein F1559_000885 [Cyanidiococcus yangmingshanensis]